MISSQPDSLLRPSKRLREVLITTLISVIAAGIALGGFWIGRTFTEDRFIRSVDAAKSAENTSLLSAGADPLNLFQALGAAWNDPSLSASLSKIYGVSDGNRDELAKRLRDVVWVPPYRPAPFVGHMARPHFGDDLYINLLGFRDQRQTYVSKPPGTVRIFITGGSTAWGSGASSQVQTISYLLEKVLNGQVSRTTGFRYEVVNAAFPGWSTTQEQILIERRLSVMHPDLIIMFSGNNDVHWILQERDIDWFHSYMDENYMTLLNEMYRSSGHAERAFTSPFKSGPFDCTNLARKTAVNVENATVAAERAGAQLVFALQPNIASTAKRLSRHEQQILGRQNKAAWDSCYEAQRNSLSRIRTKEMRMIDLSRSFGELDAETELFIDAYHFGDQGNRLMAQALADQIDWRTITPSDVIIPQGEPLVIIKVDQPKSENPFTAWMSGTSMVRVVPNRINKNLLIVFDRSVLPAVVAEGSITALLPASLHAGRGKHMLYIVDGLTGEASPPVAFEMR